MKAPRAKPLRIHAKALGGRISAALRHGDVPADMPISGEKYACGRYARHCSFLHQLSAATNMRSIDVNKSAEHDANIDEMLSKNWISIYRTGTSTKPKRPVHSLSFQAGQVPHHRPERRS